MQWKKRYFVLFKINEHDYQLRYYRNAEEKGTPIGGIELTQYVITFLAYGSFCIYLRLKCFFKMV